MWVIITRDNCSFCEKAKELLRGQNKQVKVFNVQDMENKWVLTLLKTSGLKTVPQIFKYDGAFVGGYTDLKVLIAEGPL
jgi:thioredoxin reductase (NADPH)